MSELGVFAVDRGVFDHPLLATGEPYTRREAWLWLVSEAAWKPRKVNRNGVVIELQRGQLAHSVRFMAQAWGWSKSAVDRFLVRLKTGTMIGTEGGTASIVVTICNYDVYQRVGLPDWDTSRDNDRDTSGTPAGQTRNIQTFKEEVLSEEVEGKDAPKWSRKTRNAYTSEYEAFWNAYPSTAGQSKLNGFKAWQQLSVTDQAAALASLPAYAAELKAEAWRKAKHVQGYLNGRYFETFGAKPAQPVDWLKRLTYGRQWKQWPVHQWGAMPGAAGCLVPDDLIQVGDGDGWAVARAA